MAELMPTLHLLNPLTKKLVNFLHIFYSTARRYDYFLRHESIITFLYHHFYFFLLFTTRLELTTNIYTPLYNIWGSKAVADARKKCKIAE